ncbi:superinfection immunity protein [Methylobacterium sp. SD21]|uniref:superinfection immunity protein n=1 Tax=Methylobacterium litchii TaxID=3138810 RepID=UPI00313D1449
MSSQDLTQVGAGLTIIAVSIAIYFLPALLASQRKHPHFAGILALNLLLGWTFVGWAVALVWVYVKPSTGRGTKPCPRCAERVKDAALVCRHCGYEFKDLPPSRAEPSLN